MKRQSDENLAAPSTKKYKVRWDVGLNDVENKAVQPKSEIKKRIQPKNDPEKRTQPKKSVAQQNTNDYCEQVYIIFKCLFFLHLFI